MANTSIASFSWMAEMFMYRCLKLNRSCQKWCTKPMGWNRARSPGQTTAGEASQWSESERGARWISIRTVCWLPTITIACLCLHTQPSRRLKSIRSNMLNHHLTPKCLCSDGIVNEYFLWIGWRFSRYCIIYSFRDS